jgi:putative ABC transport system permease protein
MSGVGSAALVRFAPLTMAGSGAWEVAIEGQAGKPQEVGVNVVTPRYFDTLGIPILRGRAFDDRDRAGSPGVVIVTETMARRFWPGKDVLGRHLKSGGPWLEVIGIARDSSYRSIGESPSPHMYLPLPQHPQPRMTLVVHARGDGAALIPALRREVRRVSAAMPVTGLRTFAQAVDVALFPTRAGAMLLTIFGLLALTLAAAGVYGVSSYAVSQRTREIGIRIALGGGREDILRLVVGDGLRPVAMGVILGLLLSVGLAQVLATLLLGLSPLDPVTFSAVPLVLMLTASLASYLPARRAAKVEPVVALRCE